MLETDQYLLQQHNNEKNPLVYVFGECALFATEEEEKEARIYLEYWKKNLLRKFRGETYTLSVLEKGEEWGTRPPHLVGPLCINSILYLKIRVRVEFKFSL